MIRGASETGARGTQSAFCHNPTIALRVFHPAKRQCSKQNKSYARTSKGVNAPVDTTSVEVAKVISLAVRVDVSGGGHPHMGGTITTSPPTVPVQRRGVRIRLHVPPLFSLCALVAIAVAASGGALKASHVNHATPVWAEHSRVSAGCLGHELLQNSWRALYPNGKRKRDLIFTNTV
jgi:hypothetical protein